MGGSGKHKWLIKALNEDKTIITEILSELISVELPLVKSMPIIVEKMEKYKFGWKLLKEVCGNFKNLKRDLESEGVLFD